VENTRKAAIKALKRDDYLEIYNLESPYAAEVLKIKLSGKTIINFYQSVWMIFCWVKKLEQADLNEDCSFLWTPVFNMILSLFQNGLH
jgi:hypothetical protein